MFTVCPGCTRQFRIYAKHIAAASGQVRCGFCRAQFNALDRLYDKLLSDEKILKYIQLSSEPQFYLPDPETPEKTSTNKDQKPGAAMDKTGVRPTVADIKRKLEQQSLVRQASTSELYYDFPEPGEILEEKSVKRSALATTFWVVANFVGLIVITLQLAWFNRDFVLARYPQLIPYVRETCKELDCRLIRQRDVTAIGLVNRDVRLHPKYQDTLLVNVTMENELDVRQPYPKVQLTLFDTSGVLLGYRNFVPDDYLDDSIEIDEGMPVNLPVHFVLEVTDPVAGAVSFEFRFL